MANSPISKEKGLSHGKRVIEGKVLDKIEKAAKGEYFSDLRFISKRGILE